MFNVLDVVDLWSEHVFGVAESVAIAVGVLGPGLLARTAQTCIALSSRKSTKTTK